MLGIRPISHDSKAWPHAVFAPVCVRCECKDGRAAARCTSCPTPEAADLSRLAPIPSLVSMRSSRALPKPNAATRAWPSDCYPWLSSSWRSRLVPFTYAQNAGLRPCF